MTFSTLDVVSPVNTHGGVSYTVEFPELELTQDEEWCWIHGLHPDTGLEVNQTIRFHEYGKIYKIPGLYEHLFYERLRCISPEVVCRLLQFATEEFNPALEDLRVLDFGAGNGIVGEELRKLNVRRVVGADTFTPLAGAAFLVIPSDEEIVAAADALAAD